jgi:hypothetical protein
MPATHDRPALEPEIVASVPAPLETAPTPPEPEAPPLEIEAPAEMTGSATFESATEALMSLARHDDPTLEPETAAPEPAPFDMAPTNANDAPSPAPAVSIETVGVGTPISTARDAVATNPTEPTPEPEAGFVSRPSDPAPSKTASGLLVDASEADVSSEWPAEAANPFSAMPVALDTPADVSSENGPAPTLPASWEMPATATESSYLGTNEALLDATVIATVVADAKADEAASAEPVAEPQAGLATTIAEPPAETVQAVAGADAASPVLDGASERWVKAPDTLSATAIPPEASSAGVAPENVDASIPQAPAELATVVPANPSHEITEPAPEDLPPVEPAVEPAPELTGATAASEAETELALRQTEPLSQDHTLSPLSDERSTSTEEPPADALLEIANADALVQLRIEPAVEKEASAAESDVPTPVTIEMPHVAGPQVEPPIEAAPIEATLDTEAPQDNAVSQPDSRKVAAPEDRIDREKSARDALASDLADMIHSVLSTTQFATKAMKPDRYSSVRSIDEPEPTDTGEGGEIAADALPHPVAIRARLGRMERALAFASVGMIIVVGYFVFSLWRDEGVIPAQGPGIAAAPSSRDWGERARDVSRGLGAAAVDASTSPSATPQTGSPKSADAQRLKSHGPQILQ